MSWMAYYVEESMRQREAEIERRAAHPRLASVRAPRRRRRPWRRPVPAARVGRGRAASA
jgi:hypothetical protein